MSEPVFVPTPQELERRIEELERLPILQTLHTRLFILETIAEAMFIAMPNDGRSEFLRILERVGEGDPRSEVKDELTGRTLGKDLTTYISYLRSISGL